MIIVEQLWRNWHTRMIQVHVHVGGCGFKSRQLHTMKIGDSRENLRFFHLVFFLENTVLLPADGKGN